MNLKLIALSLFTSTVLVACGNTERPPSVVDIPTYKTYITSLRSRLASADAESFQAGEQAALTRVSGEILSALGDTTSYDDFDAASREHLIALNEELHLLIFGENNVRAADRVCTSSAPTGSNIRQRSCRTRAQIAQDRAAARILLETRGDDIDRNRILDESTPGGFGTPTLN